MKVIKKVLSLFIRRVNIGFGEVAWGSGGIQLFRCPWLIFFIYEWDITGKYEGFHWLKPWTMKESIVQIWPAPPEQLTKFWF